MQILEKRFFKTNNEFRGGGGSRLLEKKYEIYVFAPFTLSRVFIILWCYSQLSLKKSANYGHVILHRVVRKEKW